MQHSHIARLDVPARTAVFRRETLLSDHYMEHVLLGSSLNVYGYGAMWMLVLFAVLIFSLTAHYTELSCV